MSKVREIAPAGKPEPPQAPVVYIGGALGELIDRVCADDAAWFREHPTATRRVRAYVENEFVFQLVPVGTAAPIKFVEVTRLAPGVRVRRPVIDPRHARFVLSNGRRI